MMAYGRVTGNFKASHFSGAMDILRPGIVLQNRYRVKHPLGQGGFSQTWEVDDGGTPKVLKLLLHTFPKAVELFKQEPVVLSSLNHSGIPSMEQDSYFSFRAEGRPEPYHCSVMEKVPGINLQQWMEQHPNQLLSEEQAISWLYQLADILSYLHEHAFFHRDIKPSNIMLRPDGQLVLIDFGGVREIEKTYLVNTQGDPDGTRLQSPGYTPLEQMEGMAGLQSDFFALGRTLVHLMTIKHPAKLLSDQGQLMWRQDAPHVSEELAQLLDEMMERFPQQRPQRAEEILTRLRMLPGFEAIAQQDPVLSAKLEPNRTRQEKYRRRLKKTGLALMGSLVTSGLLLGVRHLGGLQFLELPAYDLLLRLLPVEPPDNRLLLITVDDQDVDYQDEQGFERQGEWQSLAYPLMLDLVESLNALQPRAIGLDIYLDRLESGTELGKALSQQPNLYSVCLYANDGLSPASDASLAQVGFSDFVDDGDRLVRRHLLYRESDPANVCPADYSLSLQIANHYLEGEDISATFNEAEQLQLGQLPLVPLLSHWGGYQGADARGGQILLNYRNTPKPEAIATTLSLTEALNNGLTPELVNNRIILIGPARSNVPDPDIWQTPYRTAVSGVIVHAHMVSQLLSAVLDGRPLIQTWPRWKEWTWIWVWSFGGSVLVFWVKPNLKTVLGFQVLAVTCLIAGCYGAFLQGMWIPLVPPLLAVCLPANTVWLVNRFWPGFYKRISRLSL
ncbi:CHASE2 domain-containing protein [Nodosilinea sp. LEGE 07088]|uniref:CHASE2 domain-containing protein n=1 Tax=Nodosilinea sp. LEGE 07088 TaxID=2777968 RepID=UPI001880D1B9|nr:CHASE2 domain-containing protein [Nodosilinea sp. LEGE 07088]MBE9137041.1 CHASE2 domain-containing protein [Nodosilinea sp. LEGE 07088]